MVLIINYCWLINNPTWIVEALLRPHILERKWANSMMNWWSSFITDKEGVCLYERGEALMSARPKTGWGVKGCSSHLKGELLHSSIPETPRTPSSHFVPLLSSCQSCSNVISRLYSSLTSNSWLQIFMYLMLSVCTPKINLALA